MNSFICIVVILCQLSVCVLSQVDPLWIQTQLLHIKSAEMLEIHHGDQIALYNVDTQQGTTVVQQSGWAKVLTKFVAFGNQEKMNFTEFEVQLFNDTKISPNLRKRFATHIIYKTNNQSGTINHGDIVQFQLTRTTPSQMNKFLDCDKNTMICTYQNAPSANSFQILTDDTQPLRHNSSFQIKYIHNVSGTITKSNLVVGPNNTVKVEAATVNKWKVGIAGDTLSNTVETALIDTEIAKIQASHNATVTKLNVEIAQLRQQVMLLNQSYIHPHSNSYNQLLVQMNHTKLNLSQALHQMTMLKDIVNEKNIIQTKYENDNHTLQTTVYCLSAATVALFLFLVINLGLLRKRRVWPIISQKTDTSEPVQPGAHKNKIENKQQLQSNVYDADIAAENVHRLSLHPIEPGQTNVDNNEGVQEDLDQNLQNVQLRIEMCGIAANQSQ